MLVTDLLIAPVLKGVAVFCVLVKCPVLAVNVTGFVDTDNTLVPEISVDVKGLLVPVSNGVTVSVDDKSVLVLLLVEDVDLLVETEEALVAVLEDVLVDVDC